MSSQELAIASFSPRLVYCRFIAAIIRICCKVPDVRVIRHIKLSPIIFWDCELHVRIGPEATKPRCSGALFGRIILPEGIHF